MRKENNSSEGDDMEMPHATLLISYCKEMKHPQLLKDILENAAQKKEKVLMHKYPMEIVSSLMKKMRDTIDKINAVPNDKTIIIMVSPIVEKWYFIAPEKKLPRPDVFVSTRK